MNQRFYSLDVFRGATVAMMILVNNPGSWEHIYYPLDHSSWHGCTPTDLVFPFFLFAVGNAMSFVIPKIEANGEINFWKKIIKRSLLIFLIGLFLNWFPFVRYNDAGNIVGASFENLRFFGVLQRIALCYFFSSFIIHYFKGRKIFVICFVLLVLYWLLCIISNPLDPFSINGWFGTHIDKLIIGDNHMYHGEGIAFEPEGIMSTMTSIVQVIIGYLVGNYIVKKGKTHEMLNSLFVSGCILIFVGLCWNTVFPINKKLWTSSYTIYTSGLAIIILSLIIYIIEFKGKKGWWSHFFDVFGKNALFIFAMSFLIPKTLWLIRISDGIYIDAKSKYIDPLTWFYEKVCKLFFSSDPRMGSLIYALCFVGFTWILAWILDKKKIYFKV